MRRKHQGKKLKAEEKIVMQKQHTKTVPTSPVNIPVSKEDSRKMLSNNGNQHQTTKKKRTFLLGESTINGTKDCRLSKQHNIKVRTQTGVTTQDLEDHIKAPTERKTWKAK